MSTSAILYTNLASDLAFVLDYIVVVMYHTSMETTKTHDEKLEALAKKMAALHRTKAMQDAERTSEYGPEGHSCEYCGSH